MSFSEEDTIDLEDLEFIKFSPEVQNAIDQVRYGKFKKKKKIFN